MNLLLVRFSALGDILMTVPVIHALALQYPDLHITVVSRPYVGSIFTRLPGNVHFVGVNPRNYPGLWGLHRLYRELKALQPDAFCDLHDVLRTKYLYEAFKLAGMPVSRIHKHRAARRAFLRQHPKQQQETSFDRYRKALERLGFPLGELSCPPLFCQPKKHGVGLAPFAAHSGKVYPKEKMEQVIRLLAEGGKEVYLFGAGDTEKALTEEWERRYEGVRSMVGRLPDMAAEADFISSLEVMLTMDSGNMHLAALTHTPVVSLWGATHPLGGFLGWRQSMQHVIQMEDMPCRPCSIYGNKPCRMGGYPCLNRITPEQIVSKVMSVCK